MSAMTMKCGACMTCMTSSIVANSRHDDIFIDAARLDGLDGGDDDGDAGAPAPLGTKCRSEHAVMICAANPVPPATQDAIARSFKPVSPIAAPPPRISAAELVRRMTAATTTHPATLSEKHAQPNACKSTNRFPPVPGCQKLQASPPPSAQRRRPPTPCVTGTAIAKHARAKTVNPRRAAGASREFFAARRSAAPANANAQHNAAMTVVPVLLISTVVVDGWRRCPRP
mmetsp:Transcript_6699/g.24703  ORF Transcript_6699/g.24703 Transcript_6699/m.24703 type:complete len:228 (+) Transcript_6699:1095-1778(+)